MVGKREGQVTPAGSKSSPGICRMGSTVDPEKSGRAGLVKWDCGIDPPSAGGLAAPQHNPVALCRHNGTMCVCVCEK